MFLLLLGTSSYLLKLPNASSTASDALYAQNCACFSSNGNYDYCWECKFGTSDSIFLKHIFVAPAVAMCYIGVWFSILVSVHNLHSRHSNDLFSETTASMAKISHAA